jgi:hypothetical protein
MRVDADDQRVSLTTGSGSRRQKVVLTLNRSLRDVAAIEKLRRADDLSVEIFHFQDRSKRRRRPS